LPGGGQYLTVSVNSDFSESRLTFWNVASGLPAKTLTQTGQVSSFASSDSGDRIAVADDRGRVVVWNTETSEQAGVLNHGVTVRHMFFANDDKTIVTLTRYGLLTRWASNSLTRQNDPLLLPAPVTSFDHSSDSSLLVAAHSDGKVRVQWLNQQLPVCGALPHGTFASAVDMRPDGRQFVSGGNDGTVKQWDLAAVAPRHGLIVHEGPVLQARFSPDGRRIATASRDHTGGLWSSESGQRIGDPLNHELDVLDCDFSIDGLRLVTASVDKNVKIWDGITSARIGADRTHPDPVFRVGFTAESAIFVSGTNRGSSFAWDVGSEMPLYRFSQTATVWSVAVSDRKGIFATASDDGTVNVQNALDGSTLATLRTESPVTYCSLDPAGKLVATAGSDGNVAIWTLDDTTEPLQIVPLAADVTCCNFSHDGERLVATDRTGSVHILKKSANGFLGEHQFDLGQHSIMYAEFSEDGRFVIANGGEPQAPTSGFRRGSAYLIHVADGMLIGPPLRHFGMVYRSRFDLNTSKVVTGSLDNTARVWPLRFEAMETGNLRDYARLLAGRTLNEGQQLLGVGSDAQVELLHKLLESNSIQVSVSRQEIENWNQYKSWVSDRFGVAFDDSGD
jgi:WD40 repeat protein